MKDFYSAALAGRFRDAAAICTSDDNAKTWPNIVLDCIDRIEHHWKLDQISLIEVSDGFWTIRRVLEHIASLGVPMTAQMEAHGRILLSVPLREKHSFGAQHLTEQLRRLGYHVDLFLNRPNAQVVEQLNAQHYDVFGVSVGQDQSLMGLGNLIAEARIVSENPTLRVILGGQSFKGNRSAYDFLGADTVLTGVEDPLASFHSLIGTQQSGSESRHA